MIRHRMGSNVDISEFTIANWMHERPLCVVLVMPDQAHADEIRYALYPQFYHNAHNK